MDALNLPLDTGLDTGVEFQVEGLEVIRATQLWSISREPLSGLRSAISSMRR
jgi:hypothetical protein